jgi:hypothetical protein
VRQNIGWVDDSKFEKKQRRYIMRQIDFLNGGKLTQIDLRTRSMLLKHSHEDDFGRISIAQRYVRDLYLNNTEQNPEQITRPAHEIILSKYRNNDYESFMVFSAIARALRIPVKFTLYAGAEWLKAPTSIIDILPTLQVKRQEIWQPYDPINGTFPHYDSSPIGLEHRERDKLYLLVGEGLDFSAVYKQDSGKPLKLITLNDFVKYAENGCQNTDKLHLPEPRALLFSPAVESRKPTSQIVKHRKNILDPNQPTLF